MNKNTELAQKHGAQVTQEFCGLDTVIEITAEQLDAMIDETVSTVLDRVYDLFLTFPFQGVVPDPEDDDDAVDDSEIDCAIKVDRFSLMTEIRKLKAAHGIGKPS